MTVGSGLQTSFSQERQDPFYRLKLIVAGLSLATGFAWLVTGLILYHREFQKVSEKNFEIGDLEKDKKSNQEELVFVDVSGAVADPGVYQLMAETRVVGALTKAGGLSYQADKLWVARNLNLAKPLVNGQKIYVPFTGEQSLGGNDTNLGSSLLVGDKGLIDLNTALKTELETLPGIGSHRAEALIEGRPYQSRSELLERKILGEKTFAKIKDLVTVGGG